MVRFVLLFLACLVAGIVLLDVSWVRTWLVEPWTRFNAAAAAACANAIGIDANVEGTTIRFGATELQVVGGCNGVHAVLILLSSILAFPGSFTRKLAGIGAGTPIVLGCNILRLVSLIVVARHWPDALELFHIYIWQTLIVLIALALFLVWGTYFANGRRSDAAAASP
jgi:exosortase H (IPTLxxWG-CTERM-specific)